MCVFITPSCPTLCDPMDYSLPGSSVEFSRQEYWSGLPVRDPYYKQNLDISIPFASDCFKN